MRKIWGIGVFIFSFGLLIAGCAHIEPVKIQEKALTDENRPTTAVLYSKSFFQERFMGKQIHYALLGGPLLGAAMQYGTQSFESREGARRASSEYEKLLGDFDVSAHFYKQVKENIGKVKLLKIALEEDPQKASLIVPVLTADKKDDKLLGELDKRASCLAAFKLSYGLAAKEGAEQIGFRKYYRPFIRVLGKAKLIGSNEVIWHNALIAFSEKRYLGDEANADRINKDELIAAFKQLSEEVTDMLVKSLNGEELPKMPVLVGITGADNNF